MSYIKNMSKKLPPIDINIIADYFLYKGQEAGKPITNKKLQKLLYYSQAWSLVIRKDKLFKNKIEAWVHGPAVREVYLEYKKFGFNPITKDVDISEFKKISPEAKKLLDEVWSVYGKLDADYLELLAHSEKPWQDAREGLQSYEISENEITPEAMKNFYEEKLKHSKV